MSSFGSAKTSSGSSYLSGGSGSGGSGGSSTSESCNCSYAVFAGLGDIGMGVVVEITNTGACDITVSGIVWLATGLSVTIIVGTLPAIITPGQTAIFTGAESYDTRGLTGVVQTSCGNTEFTLPIA